MSRCYRDFGGEFMTFVLPLNLVSKQIMACLLKPLGVFRGGAVVLLLALSVSNMALAQDGDAGETRSAITFLPAIVSILLDENDSDVLRQRLRLTWVPPVMRADNTLFAPAEVASYRLRYRKQGSSDSYRYRMIPSGAYLGHTLVLQGKAGNSYELSLQTLDVEGQQSAYTSSISVEFPLL